MDMPTPKPGQSQADFMDACMAMDGMDAEMCGTCWDQHGAPGKAYAYSVLQVKTLSNSDERIIEGIATTPDTDHMGDIVESMGAQYKLPVPLLWQHRADEPVGNVFLAEPTAKGIPFKAKIAKIEEPGALKDLTDKAWQALKAGLVRGVSIGFSPLDFEPMKSGGIRFRKWAWHELSLVTIPANSAATVSLIRSIATTERMRAPGRDRTAGVSARPTVKAQEGHIKMPKPIADQITAYEATRVAKSARMDSIMDAAAERGETLDTAENEEYRTLDDEVQAVDEHLVLLRAREKRGIAQAHAVAAVDTKTASDARAAIRVPATLKVDLPKGIAWTRYVMALARAKGNVMQAAEYSKIWHDTSPQIEQVFRAQVAGAPMMVDRTAVAAGDTVDSTWASPLVYYTNMAGEFIDYLRPMTIMDRLTGLRRIPFNIKVPRQTGGATVNWVGETAPKPVSSLAFDQVSLGHSKLSGIVPVSDELLRFSNPAVETIVRNDLAAAIAQFMDSAFVDPTKALVTNVSPASITNGVTPTHATGATATALRTDLETMLKTFLAANLNPVGGAFIMTQSQALAISLMINTLGQPVFPGITMEGGTLLGFPVVASENIPSTGGSPTDGYPIIFVKANEVLVADDGSVTVDVSNEASLQMDTAPDSPATASSVMVSLWQQNMTALRVERYINWVKRRTTACAFIDYAKYDA